MDPVSDGLLGEVKDAIDNHPEIEHIEVQGHADNVGPEDFNYLLSVARADAVRKWLVARGIPKEKLISRGFGSKKPVDDNATDSGRQENRRVQFVIIKLKNR